MSELKEVVEAQGSSRQSLEWVELRSVGGAEVSERSLCMRWW